MKFTNWHTSGRANQAKTTQVHLQSVYNHAYSSHPIQITVNDRTNEDKIMFLSLTLTKEEAIRLQSKLAELIPQIKELTP